MEDGFEGEISSQHVEKVNKFGLSQEKYKFELETLKTENIEKIKDSSRSYDEIEILNKKL